MIFKDNLLKARHHLVFLAAVVSAFSLVIYLETLNLQEQSRTQTHQRLTLESSSSIPKVNREALTPQEREWANIAWRYFENNYQPETGLVNSVDSYQASTMWDTASYLMAVISAFRLNIIDEKEFSKRINHSLTALVNMPLFENKLPNKSYNTVDLSMVDYENRATTKGIGWSAIDIGRLMVPFNIIVWNYPQHTSLVSSVIARWDFKPLVKNGILFGAALNPDNSIDYLQEGRIGYEEYAAKSIALAGADVQNALQYTDFLEFVDIEGVDIPTDKRDPSIYKAHNYVVSESYVLDGLEFGWDSISEELAYRVYQAQENRYLRSNILTAVSEDNLDQAPYFVYNTVFSSGEAWNTITDSGEQVPQFKTLSTKAAFAWHMLYRTGYTEKLIAVAGELYDKEKGFYSGRYEVDGKTNKAITANTNAIILESLHFKVFGAFLKIGAKN